VRSKGERSLSGAVGVSSAKIRERSDGGDQGVSVILVAVLHFQPKSKCHATGLSLPG
jgi:hypothetical protein